MSLLTPLALIALVLLPLLVLLHLRRRRFYPAEVPSLLIWREVFGQQVTSSSRRSIPDLLLLLLQLLAVAVLVFSLAQPESAAAPARQQIFVLDNSYRMAATDERPAAGTQGANHLPGPADVQPSRLAVARQAIDRQIDRAAASTVFTVVVATAQPYVLVSSSDRAQVKRALAALTPAASAADMVTALRLAAGSLLDPRGHAASVLVAYAREETLPAVSGTVSAFSTLPVGVSSRNQALVGVSTRCTAGTRPTCMAYAAVRNEDTQTRTAPLVVEGNGAVLAERSLTLPASSVTGLSFPLPAGTHTLRVYLAQQDILPLDNAAWSVVPSPVHAQVTLVGDAASVAPVRQALAALPNVTVHVVPTARYTPAPQPANGLLILDGWLPSGPLPSVPALLLIDPPRLPGGSVAGTLSDTTISGQDSSSDLLTNVDLTSLDVAPGAAQRLVLPAGVAPVVWSTAGPLLAAGTANGQRLAVLSFEPTTSNLPQLSAFPVLLQNILSWSATWLPSSVLAGNTVTIAAPPGTSSVRIASAGLPGAPTIRQTLHPISAQPTTFVAAQPGLYTLTEQGAWGTRTGALAANMDEIAPTGGATSAPIPFGVPGPAVQQGSAASTPATPWWPWIGLLALIVIVAEWIYIFVRQEGA